MSKHMLVFNMTSSHTPVVSAAGGLDRSPLLPVWGADLTDKKTQTFKTEPEEKGIETSTLNRR